jgi:hypothetical protein
MTYYHEIKTDKVRDMNELVFKEVRSRIFFQNYYSSKSDSFIPLEEIVTTLGNKDDINTIIDACKNWTKFNRQRMAIVSCHIKEDEIIREVNIQKVLDFTICDTLEGKVTIEGGVLFQNGEISFHT